ncbi:PrsW family glutamic-type intramembrane protease [Hallella bergensis]|uniref:PrsW family glutamic-type intramembrane protease n=1 Tax=Hallella bergensis TaxID=242750 RepID=UPI0023F00A54|nr:PrsW family glutamic-type intramembrane protease [Hallella bergensis]
MNIYVIRNGQRFGPYTEQTLLSYVNQGQILVQDTAIGGNDVTQHTVGYYLKRTGLKYKVANKGNIISQLKSIGSELIFPKTTMLSKCFLTDQRFMILAIVGLLPMVIMNMPFGGFLLFYEVALYFSIIWGLFFYTCFKTAQVRLKTTLAVFFLTQVFVFAMWDLLGLPRLNLFYNLVDMPFPMSLGGYVLGVGLTEELVKLLPLIIILRKAKEPLIPQTMVFYGLMSGIAFGVYEGVGYQLTVNAERTYDVSFFLNIARLTSLPFLHACWCGIAGYFLAFAHLYPKYRRGLYALSIGVPMLIHGLYDTFADVRILPLILVFIGLMLLMVYLKHGVNYQSKLRQ